MRTYNYLSNEMPRELVGIYNDLNEDLLRLIVRKLKNGEQPQKVVAEIQDKIGEYSPKTQKVVAIIFADMKKKAVKDGKKDIEEKPVTNEEANKIIEPRLLNAFLIVNVLNNRIANSVANEYVNDYFFVNAPSTRYSSKEGRLDTVYKRLANEGLRIQDLEAKRPKAYTIDQLIRRDVMYDLTEANGDIAMQNFENSDAQFIEVSSHPTARTWNKYQKFDYEDHSSWQGQVYYSGQPVDGYEEFESTCGYGELLGICGINCYHQFQANYTGKGTQTEYGIAEIRKDYALSQEQRQYERQIRNMKQRKAVYEEAGKDVSGLRQKISMATDNLKNFCEKNNLKYFNWRTHI